MSRIRTNLETIIPLIKAQIASTNVVLDPSLIVVSLMNDRDIMQRCPTDQLITLKPFQGRVWEEAVTGGLNDLLWIDGEWEITYFLRYAVDQVVSDDRYLTDPTDGILPKWGTMIHDLQGFDPTDDDGNKILAEPMRLTPRGWESLPTSHGNVGTWGRLKSWWEVKYIHSV